MQEYYHAVDSYAGGQYGRNVHPSGHTADQILQHGQYSGGEALGKSPLQEEYYDTNAIRNPYEGGQYRRNHIYPSGDPQHGQYSQGKCDSRCCGAPN